MITDSTSKRMLDAINLQRAKLKNASSDKILRAYDASIEKYHSSTAGSVPPLPPLQPAGDEGTLGQTGTSQGRTQTKPGLSVSATSAPEMRAPQPIESAAALGPIIRRARKQMKLSQEEFATCAGVGRRFLSELEGGKPSVEFDKVLACARAAGIDIFACLRHG